VNDVSTVLVERDGPVTIVRINRLERRNAVDGPTAALLADAFRDFEADADASVAVLTGVGGYFCAGADLKGVSEGRGNRVQSYGDGPMGPSRMLLGKPVIAAVEGFAVAGGFELALACDVLIASTEARFADTHARVGIVPGWGLSQRLPRLIGIGRAKELSFTGNFIGAEQAERWGLVNHVVEPGELLPFCQGLATDMLSCEPRTLRGYKRMIDEGFAGSFGDGMRMESRRSREHLRGVTPESVAARRAGIQARGREQQREPR